MKALWFGAMMLVVFASLRNGVMLHFPRLKSFGVEIQESPRFRNALELLSEMEVDQYWFSTRLEHDVEFYQHLIFRAWPRIPDRASRYLLFDASADSPEFGQTPPLGKDGVSCKVLRIRGGIGLARC
jgi:hypothetical protein